MARRRKTLANDLFELVAILPWWGRVALALIAFVCLHGLAANASHLRKEDQ
jgi:restriction system protein